jgi:DUF1680 family protein
MDFQTATLQMLEAVGYALMIAQPRAPGLATNIDLIEKAQQPDGYLKTYYTIKNGKALDEHPGKP